MGIFDFLKNEKPVTVDLFGQTVTMSKKALAYSQLGIGKYNAQDYVGVVEVFGQSISLMPRSASLYVWRGTSYEDYGKYDEAKTDFQTALKLEPDDFLAAYRLGMIYSDRGDRAEAAHWLNESYENARFEVPHMLHLGWSKNCLFFVGKQIISHNLGIQYLESRMSEAAIPYFEHAARIEPGYANAYFGLGAANYNIGRKENAFKHFSEAAKLGHSKASSLISSLDWE